MSKGEQTRRRIVASAAPIFNMLGFAGASMSALTVATGLEKGGIYNHFASKEALALAAFDYAVEAVSHRYRDAILRERGAIARLEAMIEAFQANFHDPPVAGGCPLLNTAIDADDTSPALRERVQAAMTDWQRLIGKIVKEGVAAGDLIPTADPRVVASILTATLEGALMLSRLYGDAVHIEHTSAHLVSYVRSLGR